MFFLNLTAGEFFALLGVLGGLVTLLYLLDRAKRKKTVSTLRFWTPGTIAEQRQSRRRMREPWSLVLQLLSLLLLLLALGQLQWGSRERRGRDHVLLLDTSAWSAERAGKGRLLDLEKEKAQQFIDALPATDRVLLIRAGGLTTPVTSFTSDRARLSAALAESRPGYASFNAEQALAYAQEAQAWSGSRRGEIVYIGPRMVDHQEVSTPPMDNLRVITVASPNENCGIRGLAVKRGADDENTWQALVTIRNYSGNSRAVQLRTQFAGTPFAPRAILLKPGEERALEYNFMTNVAGELTARLTPEDNLPSDNTASLYLPRNRPLRVVAFTSRPDILKTVLSANHRLSLAISDPSKYQPEPDADVMVLDQFSPSAAPLIPSLWIQPPAAHSPLPVKATINELSVKTWNSEGDLTSGLRTHELPASTAEVFQTFEGDTAVASAAEGPIVVVRLARQGRPQLAVVGFDPLAGQLKFEVTTPLLFANLLRWLSPGAFQEWEVIAGHVGTASLSLDPGEQRDLIHPTDERGAPVPFTVRDHTLELFVGRPATISLSSERRKLVLSLTLPDVARYQWKIPAAVPEGVPVFTRFTRSSIDLWKWLALLGTLGLFLEWMLFGPRRRSKVRQAATSAPGRRFTSAEPAKELVSK